MSNLKSVSLLLSTLFLLSHAQREWSTVNYSDDFKMEYMASEDTDCNTIHFRLTHSNYPASSLPTATISGLWMGIGLGSPVMAQADYYSCSYVYTTNDANNFTFHDWSYYPDTDGLGNFNFGEPN